jgi:hypothetical protein
MIISNDDGQAYSSVFREQVPEASKRNANQAEPGSGAIFASRPR